MIEAESLQTECLESPNEILLKILSGEYWVLRRQERSTIWQVYRQIVRSDGSKVRDYYLCKGCKRLLTSRDTSSLRTHICHIKYLQQRANDFVPDLDPKVGKYRGHQIHWSYRSTKMLLALWENNIEHLRSDPSSKAIFRKIANKMNHLGLKPSDIKTKMDNLSNRYRYEAERQKVTGRPSKWIHFQELQMLLNALEEHNPSRNSLKEENSSPGVETDGLIKRNDDNEILNDNDMKSLPLLETYEEELDQQHPPPKEMYGAKHRKAKRFMAMQEERLALEKENFKSFESIMKEMISYNKNLCQVLCDE
ncbi:hypothetical protein KR032_007973 [Drosophila birchii]|nr:hypothetical protein KR032_007973 [Drosophila birchii]